MKKMKKNEKNEKKWENMKKHEKTWKNMKKNEILRNFEGKKVFNKETYSNKITLPTSFFPFKST